MTKLLINSDRKVLASQRGKIYKAPPSSLKKLLDATKNASYLFSDYTGTSVDDLIKYNDTENVTDMANMFSYCQKLQTIPLLDTSMVTNMNNMFQYCSNLQTIPQLDTGNVTNMSSMFSNCLKLMSIPQLNTSNVTKMESMFISCSKLTAIPQLDTSNVTSMYNMFFMCWDLTEIPQLDTSKVTRMSYMFYRCERGLLTIPQLDTSKVTEMNSMFYMCYVLKTIPQLDMISVTSNSNARDMFYQCKALTNLTLLNIKADLQIGSGTTWGHLLTLDSLINTIKELVNVGASRTLTMGSANLEKIANVYVKRTTTGDIPTCLSDNSNIDLAKAPCEVCESTDEGAMLITAYANSKNWTLA